jgi:hypothetical protein
MNNVTSNQCCLSTCFFLGSEYIFTCNHSSAHLFMNTSNQCCLHAVLLLALVLFSSYAYARRTRKPFQVLCPESEPSLSLFSDHCMEMQRRWLSLYDSSAADWVVPDYLLQLIDGNVPQLSPPAYPGSRLMYKRCPVYVSPEERVAKA